MQDQRFPKGTKWVCRQGGGIHMAHMPTSPSLLGADQLFPGYGYCTWLMSGDTNVPSSRQHLSQLQRRMPCSWKSRIASWTDVLKLRSTTSICVYLGMYANFTTTCFLPPPNAETTYNLSVIILMMIFEKLSAQCLAMGRHSGNSIYIFFKDSRINIKISNSRGGCDPFSASFLELRQETV